MNDSRAYPRRRLFSSVLLTTFLSVCFAQPASPQQTPDGRGAQGHAKGQDVEVEPDRNLTEAQKEERLAEAARLSKEAFALLEKGDYDGAIALGKQVLVMRFKVLGHQHRLMAISWANLALMYHKKRDDVQAEEMLQRALVVYKNLIRLLQDARDGKGKAYILYEVGVVYYSLDQYQAALDYFSFARSHYRIIRDQAGEALARQAVEKITALVRAAEGPPATAPGKPELVVQAGHAYGPRALAFSPDGRLLATGAEDGAVKLWEVSTGRVLRTLYGAKNPVAFSRDGRWVVTGDLRGQVTLWDAATGERSEMRAIPYEATYTVFGVAISPDGQTLMTAHGDGAVGEWNTTLRVAAGILGMHGAERHDGGHISVEKKDDGGLAFAVGNSISVEGNTARGVAYSPDGRTVASCGDDKTIKLWDAASGRLMRNLTGHEGYVWDVAFSPDGQWLASAGGVGDSTVRIWEVSTGRTARVIKWETPNIISSVAFSPDGRLVAGGGDKVKVWEAATGREVKSFEGAHGDVAFSPDGQMLATGSGGLGGRTVTLWDVTSGREVRTLGGNTESVTYAAFSPDGRLLATGGAGSITLWELGNGHAPFKLSGDSTQQSIYGFVFSPDGRKLATNGSDGKVKVWSLATRRELYSLEGGQGADKFKNWVHQFVFSPDGQWLVTGDSDGTIKLRDAETGRETRTLAAPPPKKNDEAVSPSRGETAKKSRLQAIIEDFRKLVPGTSVNVLTFSPDGKMLAYVNSENDVTIQDVATGRVLQTFSAYTKNWGNGVNAMTFSPDGRNLTTGDFSGVIKFWDVGTGRELRQISEPKAMNLAHSILADPDNQLVRLVYRADGRYLAALGKGDKVKVWDVSTGRKAFTLATRATLSGVDWSRDGRFLVTSSFDGTTRLWDGATGEPLASLITFGKGDDWLAVAPDGLFDGTPEAWNKILWRFTPDTFDVQPVEAFFNEFFYPGLLDELMQGKRPKSAQSITQKDRRQPRLSIEAAAPDAAQAGLGSRTLKLRIEVAEAPADAAHATGSGVRDVRLFRNGSLVRAWHGDINLRGGRATLEASIPIVAGENSLTAYAFNRDNVKSADATGNVRGAESLRRAGTLYVVTVGVNEYANHAFDLKYAVPDALAFGEELRRRQSDLGRYSRVEVIPLLDKEATKENFLAVFKLLAGTPGATLPVGAPASLARVSVAQPEDAVVVYFAGHGTAQQNRFYLIPHDLGYAGGRTQGEVAANIETILRRAISDVELESAFEGVDAGQLLFVIDACNSGQALESEEKRRGPMNSKGLAQLAYEKGMYVLTAAQSYQEARGAGRLGHGYLTYALVEEGLKTPAADTEPADGEVRAREWLDYATDRVPKMQQETGEGRELKHDRPVAPEDELQRPRAFYRRGSESYPFVIAKTRGSAATMRGDAPAIPPPQPADGTATPNVRDTTPARPDPLPAAPSRGAQPVVEHVTRDPTPPRPYNASGHALLGDKYFNGAPPDYGRALAEYRMALAIDPKDEQAWQGIALVALRRGNLLTARDAINQLTSINPSNPALQKLRDDLRALSQSGARPERNR